MYSLGCVWMASHVGGQCLQGPLALTWIGFTLQCKENMAHLESRYSQEGFKFVLFLYNPCMFYYFISSYIFKMRRSIKSQRSRQLRIWPHSLCPTGSMLTIKYSLILILQQSVNSSKFYCLANHVGPFMEANLPTKLHIFEIWKETGRLSVSPCGHRESANFTSVIQQVRLNLGCWSG